MATLYNRQRQRLRSNPEPDQMFLGGIGKFFGNIGKGIFQGVKGIADFGLSSIGLGDIIDNSFVDRSKALTGITGITGGLAPFAANFIPGLGPAVSAGLRGAQGLSQKFFGNQPQQQPQFMNPYGGFGMGMGMGMGMGFPYGGMNMFGMPNFGGFNSFFPGFGQAFNLLGQIAGSPIGAPQQGLGASASATAPNQATTVDLSGGTMSPGQLPTGLPLFQAGGPVQNGGLVDIQAEKGELIFHPTGYLTPVHANRSHRKMERSGDSDVITDHPLEGSFIFSDFLKIKKSDADNLVVGVKRYPYKEGKKGKEPEIFSVGDLFKKNEKKRTPAELAKRISNVYKVTNDTNDVFNVLGDQLNLQNRLPYLEGISTLSEIEREKDDTIDQINQLGQMIFAKKGGTMRSRRVYSPIRARMMQAGGLTFPGFDIFGNPLGNGPVTLPTVDVSAQADLRPNFPFLPPVTPPFLNSPVPGLPSAPTPSFGGGLDFLPTPGLPSLGGLTPTTIPSFEDRVNAEIGNNPIVQASQQERLNNQMIQQQLMNQMQQGQMMTQFVDQGSPFLRGLGQAAIPIGGALNFGANLAGAIGSFDLNRRFIDENRDFFAGQRDLVNQSRDIASAGNMFDVGLNFLQQGPVDQEERFSSRLRQFDPMRSVNIRRQLADESLGQINSLIRNNPNARAINVGSAISANNQAIANATDNALNQQLEIDRFLDEEDFFNQGVRTGNQQRRIDFGNQLIQGARPGFQGLFSNEASRPLDILGLNTSERQADIAFRQNKLMQPVSFLSTAGNSLSNLGASALSLGTNFVPQQVPIGFSGQGIQSPPGMGLMGTINSIGSIANALGSLGVFEKGGRSKKSW